MLVQANMLKEHLAHAFLPKNMGRVSGSLSSDHQAGVMNGPKTTQTVQSRHKRAFASFRFRPKGKNILY